MNKLLLFNKNTHAKRKFGKYFKIAFYLIFVIFKQCMEKNNIFLNWLSFIIFSIKIKSKHVWQIYGVNYFMTVILNIGTVFQFIMCLRK